MSSGAISDQIARVRAEMASRPPGLVAHTERVIVEAHDLAQRWDVDPERAELAAWGHDLFRAHAPEDLLRLAAEAGVPIGESERASPVFLHGPIAAVVLRERLAVTDAEVLLAVREHTTGLAEMPLLAKILLLADKVEPRKRKRSPELAPIRRLARRDIDTALLCWADWKLVQERERGWLTHPQHWTARQRWVHEHHLDHPVGSDAAEPLGE